MGLRNKRGYLYWEGRGNFEDLEKSGGGKKSRKEGIIKTEGKEAI